MACVELVAKNVKRGASRRVLQNKTPKKGYKSPPQNSNTVISRHRFRFVANGAGGLTRTLNDRDFLDLLCVATGAAVAYRVLAGVKIIEIEMWSANSGVAANTVQIEWSETSGTGGPGMTLSDTAIGINDIAHICAKPLKESRASFWLANLGNTVCEIVCPQGTVVDVTLDICFFDSEAPIAVTGAVAAATTGKFYYRPLDSTNAAPGLLPISADYI